MEAAAQVPVQRRRGALPGIMALLPALAVVVWLDVRFAPLGFNPTDDGFVLAQARRILAGQVPHRDFISPRPAGGPLLHTLEFALPLPLFDAGRLVAAIEVGLYSCLLAGLLLGPPRRWGPAGALGAAASIAANLHTAPLLPWYTVDGLVLVTAGAALTEWGRARARRTVVAVGLLAVGLAAITKQSFVPALPLVWLRLVSASPRRPGASAIDAALLALPSLAYAAVIAALGGATAMRQQLGSSAPLYGGVLLETLVAPEARMALAAAFVLALGIAASDALTARAPTAARGAGLFLRLGLSGLVLHLLRSEDFAYFGWWARCLWWTYALAILATRRAAWGDVLVLALGWMCALSWGYAVPNLVGGSLALGLLHHTWAGWGPVTTSRPLRTTLAIGAAAAALLVVAQFARVRPLAGYRDVPERGLTAPLAEMAPAFGRLRASALTATYIAAILECRRRHPARFVAILPDNAGLYPALQLENPFPVDWMSVAEVAGNEAWVIATARDLAQRGDYLVLFQTVAASDLRRLWSLPDATADSPIAMAHHPLARAIADALGGERILCGPFVGYWAPAR